MRKLIEDRKRLILWPKNWSDLMDRSDSAYDGKVNSQQYEAEKGLLELYRSFVTELLRMSLAGVAILGFLSKLAVPVLPVASKWFGAASMLFFAISSLLALTFLYVSANGYRAYIAGLRAKVSEPTTEIPADDYLKLRKKMLKVCRETKLWATVSLAIGAFLAMFAIWAAFVCV